MTVKELTDALYLIGYGRDEVRFNVKGCVSSTEELYGEYHGTHDFTADIDRQAEVDAIDKKGDAVEVTLWL